MIQWIIQLFATNKTASDTDTMKPEVHKHQKNNMKSVSNKFLIVGLGNIGAEYVNTCLLYTSPSPRDATLSRMPSSA